MSIGKDVCGVLWEVRQDLEPIFCAFGKYTEHDIRARGFELSMTEIDKLRAEVDLLRKGKEFDAARLDRWWRRIQDLELQLSEARKLVQGYRDHSLDYGKRSEKGGREEYTAACQLMIFDEILERWPKHITNERCTCPDTKLHGGEKALCPWCKSQREARKANDSPTEGPIMLAICERCKMSYMPGSSHTCGVIS